MKGTQLVCGLSLAALAGLAPPSDAQSTEVAAQLDAWRADHGASWNVRGWYDHSYARMLYGGNAAPAFAPTSDADFVTLARNYVDQTGAMFAVDNSVLAEDSVMLLPLAQIGTTDKMTVRFAQEVNGVPVEYGSVNVLMSMEGELLSIDARAIPNVALQDTIPTIDSETALRAAAQAFQAETGTPANEFSAVTLNVIRQDIGGTVAPALAWRVQATNRMDDFEPESFVFQISAQDAPVVLRKDDGIHHFDVGGTVMTNATVGDKPDTAANPPQPVPAAYMTVTASGVGTTTTDENGDFNFPGVTGPINVTFVYDGLYNNVRNNSGGDYTLTQALTGTGNSVLLNPTPNGDTTAQSNIFYYINLMRDWTRAQNAADSSMDFVNTSNANINSSCNAFYDGSSTNYYRPGGGCVNTAYNSVIYHEQGHWQNDRYNSGNGFDGFGEGNADVYGIYQTNNPLVGEDFFGPGTTVRDANNLRQYCGDGNLGCYGQVHTDGEVLMGVMWKVRQEISATLGDPAAVAITDALHSGWMNAYDQGTIDSIIETQWLTLDDDNGDIQDGTPNYEDINDGFLIQGFPGVFIGGSQSKADTRNGSGSNPDIFFDTTLPIIGQSFDSTIDASGGVGTIGTFTRAYYFERSLSGVFVSLGEVLVDPTSVLYGTTDARILNNGMANHSISIPPDISIDALPVYVQAYLPTDGILTNAIDLCIGTF